MRIEERGPKPKNGSCIEIRRKRVRSRASRSGVYLRNQRRPHQPAAHGRMATNVGAPGNPSHRPRWALGGFIRRGGTSTLCCRECRLLLLFYILV